VRPLGFSLQDKQLRRAGLDHHGLADSVLAEFAPEHRIRVPMLGPSRSLNLSNTVALVVYEAWRQLSFRGSSELPRKPILSDEFLVFN